MLVWLFTDWLSDCSSNIRANTKPDERSYPYTDRSSNALTNMVSDNTADNIADFGTVDCDYPCTNCSANNFSNKSTDNYSVWISAGGL